MEQLDLLAGETQPDLNERIGAMPAATARRGVSWRLDDRTRAIGRHGLREARRALQGPRERAA